LAVCCLVPCEKRNISFSIIFFGQMDYIFHKLSGNTKHVNFQLHMSPWWIFVKNGLQVQFSYIFWGALICSHMAEISQGLKDRVPKKMFFLPLGSWVFTFFHFFVFAYGSTWCHVQCDCANLNVKYLISFKKSYKFYSVGVLSQDSHQQKEF
jgi:hypothetical protein